MSSARGRSQVTASHISWPPILWDRTTSGSPLRSFSSLFIFFRAARPVRISGCALRIVAILQIHKHVADEIADKFAELRPDFGDKNREEVAWRVIGTTGRFPRPVSERGPEVAQTHSG